MARQILLLSKLSLINLFGNNELRHTKNPAKKWKYLGMGLAYMIVMIFLGGYLALFSYGMIQIGMGEMLPMYLYTVVSLVILFFTFLKAGSMIFEPRLFERQISLPVSSLAIIISRFAASYLINVLLGIFVMLPGTIVYGIFLPVSLSFYGSLFLGMLVLPLLPMTLASVAGAAISAVTAKMKYKSLGQAGLMLLFLLAICFLPFLLPKNQDFSVDFLKPLLLQATEWIGRIYPPSLLFHQAVCGNWLSLFWLMAGSVLIFFLFLFGLQRVYPGICRALAVTGAKNKFRMKKMKHSSLRTAFWRRELRRYFASGIYLVNTVTGYVMMALMALFLLIAGSEKMDAYLPIAGGTAVVMPYIMSFFASVMTTTACSISMEGKNWWMMQTLPVQAKDVMQGKFLLNLTVAAPFYVVAGICTWIAVKPGPVQGILMLLVPAAYILFTTVAGLSVNLLFPVFNWESETQVVKQSASTMVTMIVGMVSVAVPVICLFAVKNTVPEIIMGINVVVLLILTVILYIRNSRINLQKIQ